MKFSSTVQLVIVFVTCVPVVLVSCKVPAEVDNTLEQVIKSKVKDYLVAYLDAQKKLTVTGLREKIVEYTNNLIQLTDGSLLDRPHLLHHPVDLYRFVRNHTVVYSYYVEKLEDTLKQAKDETFDLSIFKKVEQFFPTLEDYAHAVLGLLKLQEVYSIGPNDVSRGNLFQSKLTAKESRDFSHAAFVTNRNYLAREWIMESYRLLDEEGDKTDNEEDVTNDASLMAFSIGNIKDAYIITSTILHKYPDNESAKRRLSQITLNMGLGYSNYSVADQEEMDARGHHPTKLSPLLEEYNRLCRQSGRPYTGDPALVCYHDDVFSSVLRYPPFKIEVISATHGIFIIHNSLETRALEEIKTKAKPKILKPSSSSKPNPESLAHAIEDSVILNRRAELDENEISEITRRRLNHLFPLHKLASHALQVTNYAIGGDIDHSDNIIKESQNVGEMSIFRSMIYLSSPEEGGATIFPMSGDTIYPKAGSMLVWKEFQQGKDNSALVTNSECPVIIGDKWTASYRTIPQEYR